MTASGIDDRLDRRSQRDSLAIVTAETTTQGTFSRIRKAYEQIADQIRKGIFSGEFAPGQRLSTENDLAKQFGVSRTTVREALRVLAAENLIYTLKGPGGGSFVTTPSIDQISDFLAAGVSRLTETRRLSLEEFLEMRELVEVRAARLAALRRTDEDVELLQSLVLPQPLRVGDEERFMGRTDFHSHVIDACKNTLLYIAAQPIFSVLQPALFRSPLDMKVYERINNDHGDIARAIAASDADSAEELMKNHLGYLNPIYEDAWHREMGDADVPDAPMWSAT